MKINARARVRLETVGGIPVLYIEDFYADPDAVRSAALGAEFGPAGARYPGKMARVERTATAEAAATIASVVTRMSDMEVRPEDIDCDFSIVTVPPCNFSTPQRYPHIDPWPVFGIVYLTPGSTEGTSLYFSKALGYAAATSVAQRDAHEQLLREHDAADPEAAGHLSLWHRIHTIEPLYNRFVLFPGNVLHGLDIAGAGDADITRARLTQRFIVRRIRVKGEPQTPSLGAERARYGLAP